MNETKAIRGGDVQLSGMFGYESLESRVPSNHPLRKMMVYGTPKVEFITILTASIYTLLRVTKLLDAVPA